MKRFTVMLTEESIALIKRAKYNPSKKRILIEEILKELFYHLENINYPNKITVGMHIDVYETK